MAIVEQQQGAGYMYGKGALDKNDLLFLREQADREKEKEMGLIESETLQYAALRASMDVQSEQEPLPSSRQPPSAAALAAAAKAKEKHRPLLKLVTISKKPRLDSKPGDSSIGTPIQVQRQNPDACHTSAAASAAGGSSTSNPSAPKTDTGCAGEGAACGNGKESKGAADTPAGIESAGSGLLGLFGDYDSEDNSESGNDEG
ncbi:MAG: hypothetical protein WDW36_000789 [Sanguina aurantia]